MYFIIITLSIISGVFYKLGGTGGAWWKNTKARDFGVPAMAVTLLLLLGASAPWWIFFLLFGCMFGSLTTYCKFGGQENVEWFNWCFTGILYGIAALPFAWFSGNWIGFAIRTVVLGFSIMFVSEKFDNVFWEEGSRGILFTATIPLLLI